MQISQIVKKWREDYKEEVKEEKDALMNLDQEISHIYKHISLCYETEKNQWIKKLPEFIQHLDEIPLKAKSVQDTPFVKRQEEIRPKKQEESVAKRQEEIRPKKQEESVAKKQEEPVAKRQEEIRPKKQEEVTPKSKKENLEVTSIPSIKEKNLDKISAPSSKANPIHEDEWEQARHEFTRGIFEEKDSLSSEKWQGTKEKKVVQADESESDDIPEIFSNNYWDMEDVEETPDFSDESPEDTSDFAEDLLWDEKEDDYPNDYEIADDDIEEKETNHFSILETQNDSDFENLENLLKCMGKEKPENKDHHQKEFYSHKKRKRNDNDRRMPKDKKQNGKSHNNEEKSFGESKKKKYRWD